MNSSLQSQGASSHTSGAPAVTRDRILRLPEVEHRTGLSRSTVYTYVRSGKFPRQIHIHRRLTGWSEIAVLTWIQEQLQGGAQ